ncbi:hypothetical protein [Nonomuraea typhae]|uniref:hypothetical protein n=1 Tax=Nonomuraea typhae TaxID=2603600 RepID=UPI0012FCE2CA|nr:hypothetical protein [Nonomuraea typhae]
MLFEQRLREGIADGTITLAFRRWKRSQVKPGGRYRMGDGRIAGVSAVEVVTDITDDDARAAGFPDAATLRRDLDARGADPIHRIAVHLAEAKDPRDTLAESVTLSEDDVAGLAGRLTRFGPWAEATLRLIAEHPGVRAGDLAPEVGQDLPTFKLNVRKLKNLGLTISLETGYRISPRGRAYLDMTQAPP